MLILAVNVAFAVIFALINMQYVASFEVAFVGAGLVFYSSYRAIMQKITSFTHIAESNLVRESAESNALDSANIAESTQDNLPKKERFFLGAKISFGLLRILSYALLGISIIALINNGAFFLIPFLAGIALSTLTNALYVARKGKSATL